MAEYDRRQVWAAWDCPDMAAWLAWKCGISPVTAGEPVRVARARARFRRLRDHVARGRLSYSQARSIARVASEHSEAQLVELAPVMTAAQLETVTRAYRRTAAADADSAGDGPDDRFLVTIIAAADVLAGARQRRHLPDRRRAGPGRRNRPPPGLRRPHRHHPRTPRRHHRGRGPARHHPTD